MRIFKLATLVVVFFVTAGSELSAGASGQTDWPTYGSTYENTRFAGIESINRGNVSALVPAWRFVMGAHEHVETTPIVIGGTMYVTEGVGNNVIALDAVTGKQKWRYHPQIGFISACCGAINRGVAVEGEHVFVATLDAQLIALDRADGKPLWQVKIGNPAEGISETMAPLAWNGIVFIGSSGSDFGMRGSFSAYRASDGKLLWRWYAVSPGWEGRYVDTVNGESLHRDIAREKRDSARYANAWRHGGGAVWMTPALDTRTARLFLATSNPYPVHNGSVRPGDNLYTSSIVALDARTGKLLWYYQQIPHDVWEYEPSSPPVLFDATATRSKTVQAVGQAGKNRYFYVLDRSSGALLRLASFAVDGRPQLYVSSKGDADELPLRGTMGPISYSPASHLAFVTEIDRPEYHKGYTSGQSYWRDFIAAINVNSGKIVWRRMLTDPQAGVFGDHMVPGAVSTEQVVFVSDPGGVLYALDARNGDVLWRYQLASGQDLDVNAGPLQRFAHSLHDWLEPIKRAWLRQPPQRQAAASVFGSPMIYRINGREFIAIGVDVAPDSASGGAEIRVFALPGD